MAKRKAAVNDIIYELDNEDVEASSDEEVKEPKKNRLEPLENINPIENEVKQENKVLDAVGSDTSKEKVIAVLSPANSLNGGKTDQLGSGNKQNVSESPKKPEEGSIDTQSNPDSQKTIDEVDCAKKAGTDCKTTILNEDIVIDSPGNSDLGVEGCENRTPIVTVRFKDKKLARNYKEQVKAFMLNLIKLHGGESFESDSETDIELDIWPEDLVEEKEENNLFFVDTDPGDERVDVPRYSQTSSVISNIPEREPSPPLLRRGPTCFNCDGNHSLRECTQPKNFVRIANNRKSLPAKVGRYHVEDDQKFGHLIPGRLSGQLRHALGLKRHEIPLHIYRMRILGYPPGWLEEARISHSGISMFDSTGTAILEPEEEEGEVCEPGSKDKFDIKKILDFPGFNVTTSPRYKEEAHLMGLPPMSEQDSKLSMLQFLAPNAMKAYKRKKLTMFPSATSNNTTLEGQAEMDIDSGDDATEFPSVPPLPDEAPPPPPPPPPTCPPSPPPTCPPPEPSPKETPVKNPEEKSSGDELEVIEVLKVGDIPIPMSDFIVIDEDESEVDQSHSSDRVSPTLDDLEAKKKLLLDALDVGAVSDNTETEKNKLNKTNDTIQEVADILNDEESTDKQKNVVIKPTNDDNTASDAENVDDNDANVETGTDNEPNVDTIANNDDIANREETIDESKQLTEVSTDIDVLESKDSISQESTQTQESFASSQLVDTEASVNISQIIDSQESATDSTQTIYTQESVTSSQLMETDPLATSTQKSNISIPIAEADTETINIVLDTQSSGSSSIPKTPDNRTGQVKGTEYGTPVMNIASSYMKLPTDENFAKDICDVINFENLPNSTGKYKQISALLKKVKSEVDRIQDS